MEEYKLDLIQDLACFLEAYQNNNLNGSFYVRVGEEVMEFKDKRTLVLALAVLNRPAIVYRNGQFYATIRNEKEIYFIPYFCLEIS